DALNEHAGGMFVAKAAQQAMLASWARENGIFPLLIASLHTFWAHRKCDYAGRTSIHEKAFRPQSKHT
ncbi:MAG: hypothetical protein IIX72_03145, partial [Oscillospiraceae bacterium]|nr:hypothetical protein [Oscillospiraceae bacterium]